MGSAEDLYIKMNSRGKPLTEFETFKARLGQTIAHTGRADEFGHKIDGAWADLLWPYRGDNDIVDDEFMRYFDFVLEICEWREDRIRSDATDPTRTAGAGALRREQPTTSRAPRVLLRRARRLGG